MDVAPGTIVLWSDIACPWAHACVARLHRFRTELDLDDAVRLDHRAFPLELFNERPTPKKVLDAEIAAVGAVEPDAGWQMWQGPESTWPVTTLLAMEAVQAAKEQGLRASEQLDLGLRRAFFAQSRCVSMLDVILAVAADCPDVDDGAIADALGSGRARAELMRQRDEGEKDEVKGSPHVFLADGTSVHNPGISMHWVGEHGEGFPVIDADDPAAYRALLTRAAAR